MDILSNNEKTNKSVNLPIEQTCEKTCPFYGNGCYGQKGRCNFGNVINANLKRFELFRKDADLYFLSLRVEILRSGLSHIRIFGVGDFPNKEYARRLIELMASTPQIQYWIATYKAGKRYAQWKDIVDAINALPNAICRISCQDSKRRKRHDYTSAVVDANASCPCTSGSGINCALCGHKCWQKSVKLVTYKKH